MDLLKKYTKQLAININHQRNRRRLKQTELSELTGIPQSVISYLEKGTGNPKLSQIVKIAQFFNLPIAKLFEFSQNLIEVYDLNNTESSSFLNEVKKSNKVSQLPREIDLKFYRVKKEEIRSVKPASHRQLLICALNNSIYVRVEAIGQIHQVSEHQLAVVPGGKEIDFIAYPENARFLTIEMPLKEGR